MDDRSWAELSHSQARSSRALPCIRLALSVPDDARPSRERRPQAQVEIKRRRVGENRSQGSPDPDLGKRQPQSISPGGYRGKRNIGRHVRKLDPLLAEVAPTLRVDGVMVAIVPIPSFTRSLEAGLR